MVELLAAIPSVVLGLWGILVFGPWVARAPRAVARRRWLGFLPDLLRRAVAGGHPPGRARAHDHDHPDHVGDLPRALHPRRRSDLTDGALALGSTRWEAIRGVMFTYAAPGIAAAVLLGLGRAFGEAIAVNQTIGERTTRSRVVVRARRLARQQDRIRSTSARRASSRRSRSSTSAAILMVISLVDQRRRRSSSSTGSRRRGGQ